MSEFPFMHFWVADYFADTRTLECDEHGAYLQLIFSYWQQGGPLVDDDKMLAKLTSLSVKKWKKIAPKVKSYFTQQDGLLIHGRVEAELEKARKKSKKARESVMHRYNGRSTNVGTNVVQRARVSEPEPDKTLNPPVELDPELDDHDSPENLPIEGNPDLDAAELEGEPDPQDRANWKALFVFWQEQHDHPRALFTKEREAKLRARLREGYTLEDCAAAIRGVKKSKFHMGDNPDGKMWNEWTLIFRSGAYLEKFRDLDLEGVKT